MDAFKQKQQDELAQAKAEALAKLRAKRKTREDQESVIAKVQQGFKHEKDQLIRNEAAVRTAALSDMMNDGSGPKKKTLESKGSSGTSGHDSSAKPVDDDSSVELSVAPDDDSSVELSDVCDDSGEESEDDSSVESDDSDDDSSDESEDDSSVESDDSDDDSAEETDDDSPAESDDSDDDSSVASDDDSSVESVNSDDDSSVETFADASDDDTSVETGDVGSKTGGAVKSTPTEIDPNKQRESETLAAAEQKQQDELELAEAESLAKLQAQRETGEEQERMIAKVKEPAPVAEASVRDLEFSGVVDEDGYDSMVLSYDFGNIEKENARFEAEAAARSAPPTSKDLKEIVDDDETNFLEEHYNLETDAAPVVDLGMGGRHDVFYDSVVLNYDFGNIDEENARIAAEITHRYDSPKKKIKAWRAQAGVEEAEANARVDKYTLEINAPTLKVDAPFVEMPGIVDRHEYENCYDSLVLNYDFGNIDKENERIVAEMTSRSSELITRESEHAVQVAREELEAQQKPRGQAYTSESNAPLGGYPGMEDRHDAGGYDTLHNFDNFLEENERFEAETLARTSELTDMLNQENLQVIFEEGFNEKARAQKAILDEEKRAQQVIYDERRAKLDSQARERKAILEKKAAEVAFANRYGSQEETYDDEGIFEPRSIDDVAELAKMVSEGDDFQVVSEYEDDENQDTLRSKAPPAEFLSDSCYDDETGDVGSISESSRSKKGGAKLTNDMIDEEDLQVVKEEAADENARDQQDTSESNDKTYAVEEDDVIPVSRRKTPEAKAKYVDDALTWLRSNNRREEDDDEDDEDDEDDPTGEFRKLDSMFLKKPGQSLSDRAREFEGYQPRTLEEKDKYIDDAFTWLRSNDKDDDDDDDVNDPTGEFRALDSMFVRKPGQTMEDRAREFEHAGYQWRRSVGSNPADDDSVDSAPKEKIAKLTPKEEAKIAKEEAKKAKEEAKKAKEEAKIAKKKAAKDKSETKKKKEKVVKDESENKEGEPEKVDDGKKKKKKEKVAKDKGEDKKEEEPETGKKKKKKEKATKEKVEDKKEEEPEKEPEKVETGKKKKKEKAVKDKGKEKKEEEPEKDKKKKVKEDKFEKNKNKKLDKLKAAVKKAEKGLDETGKKQDSRISELDAEAEAAERELESVQEQIAEEEAKIDVSLFSDKDKKKLKDSTGIIAYLKKENKRLRASTIHIMKDFNALQENNTRLTEANLFAEVSSEAMKGIGMNSTHHNTQLTDNLKKYKKQNTDLKGQLRMRQGFFDAESSIRVGCQKAISVIVEMIQDQCDDEDLTEDILVLALECEEDAKSELAAAKAAK